MRTKGIMYLENVEKGNIFHFYKIDFATKSLYVYTQSDWKLINSNLPINVIKHVQRISKKLTRDEAFLKLL